MTETDQSPIFSPIRTRRAFEEVVAQVAEAIRSGQIRVGDRLPPERILAAQLQVSRPTVREALRVLADVGAVEMMRGRNGGAIVRSAVVETGLLEESTSIHFTEVSGVLVARRMIEPRIAALACLHASEGDLRELARTIELQQEFVDDRNRFLKLDIHFHTQIARATANGTVIEMMRVLIARLSLAYDLAFREPQDPPEGLIVSDHSALLNAIAARDPDRAEEVMKLHLTRLEGIWKKATGHGIQQKVPTFLADVSSTADGMVETVV